MAGRLALREGFTTGSAATGAVLAALSLLVTGEAPTRVAVPLPPFAPDGQPRDWLTLAVAHCAAQPAPCLDASAFPREGVAHATIIKDGGDDPDVTSGLPVNATVALAAMPDCQMAGHRPRIALHGGPGVGRVTLPGLPVPVGEAAINPGPAEQIRRAIWLWLETRGLPCPELDVTISVEGGAAVAAKTFNPRLGIVGGISILGTQGTVRPFSHEAFRATILEGLAVAQRVDPSCVCLTTGRRSEKLLMQALPHVAAHNFVQVADFAQFALEQAGTHGFARIVWGCFFGKLLKLAQGLPNTHAHEGLMDMTLLTGLCRELGGVSDEGLAAIASATTAAQALELLLAEPGAASILARIAAQAGSVASRFAGQRVELFLFHTDGRLLCGPQDTTPAAGARQG